MRAAGDHARAAAVTDDCGAVARDAARLGRESDQGPERAILAHLGERVSADKLTLGELDSPAQPRLVRVDSLVHVGAIQAKRGLQARGVPRSEACRKDALRRSAFQ